jgi:hypothetical protein
MGRFVDGTGSTLGNAFQISDGERADAQELRPDVTYDSQRDQFFVVWDSNDIDDVRGDGRVIRGAVVTPDGSVTPSILVTGEGATFFAATTAYGSTHDAHLVAYQDFFGQIHARRVEAGSLEVGDPEDIIVDGFKFTEEPDAAFDAAAGRWLVVWSGGFFGDNTRGEPDTSREVYGRSLDGNLDGSETERISHDNESGIDEAREPAVSPDTAGGGFLVVYSGAVPILSELPNGQLREARQKVLIIPEVFSRRVNGDGTVSGDAHQVSGTENADVRFDGAFEPDVWHDPNADQFLVSWTEITNVAVARGKDEFFESEVFGAKVDNGGVPIEDEQQISNHRPDGGMQFDGDRPAVTYDRNKCDYVVSWTGEEFEADEKENDQKQEIWDRAYDAPPCPTATTVAASARPPVRCASVRNFPIHLVTRRGREYEFVLVKVNGQPVQVKYGSRVEALVNLIGLPTGRFSVEIQARLKDGRTLNGVRRYFTCTKKLPPSNGLEREDAL